MNIADRTKGAIVALIKQLMAKYDYACLWPCTVVCQNADDTLELLPDSTTLPGLSAVPIWSFPGTKVKVSAGARVRVGFDEANPAKPFAALFEPSGLVELQFGGIAPVARQGDSVVLTMPPMLPIFGQVAPPLPSGTNFVGTITIGTPLTGSIITGSAKAKA